MSDSDNTTGMKKQRAYKRLLCAVLESAPEDVVDRLIFEATDCATNLSIFEEELQKTRVRVQRDTLNYYIHYQGGRPVAVLKNSPLGRKLAKGAFKDD